MKQPKKKHNEADFWDIDFDESLTDYIAKERKRLSEKSSFEFIKETKNKKLSQESTKNKLTKEDLYLQVLELTSYQNFSEIKTAYRKLIKIYHPDNFNDNTEKQQLSLEVTHKLNEAYDYFEKKFE